MSGATEIVFAELRPRNYAARQAFHRAAEAILFNDRYAYHKQHIRIDEEPSLVTVAREDTPQPEHSQSTTEADSDAASRQELMEIWTGAYVFSLSRAPERVGRAWSIGGGRFTLTSQDPSGSVDFLISDPARRIRSVRGMHAAFLFDRTGMLLLRAIHGDRFGVLLRGRDISRAHGALNTARSEISIGPLQYEFVYTISGPEQEEAFQKEKLDFFTKKLGWEEPHPALSATPSASSMQVGDWVFSSALGKGASGNVSAGQNVQGRAAAIKIITRPGNRILEVLDREARVLEILKPLLEEHDINGRIMRVVEIIRPERFSVTDAFVHGFIISEPLARLNFDGLVELEGSMDLKIECFRQVLEGLKTLHGLRWVHCDVKPANLGIVSMSPAKAVIFDLGSAQYLAPGQRLLPEPGGRGTVGFLAPEMERADYDETVDIWALGIVGYQLLKSRHPFLMQTNPWRDDDARYIVTRSRWVEKYDSAIENLKSYGENTFEDLLVQMLQYDEGSSLPVRISSAEALRHASWRYMGPDSYEGQSTKRVRR